MSEGVVNDGANFVRTDKIKYLFWCHFMCFLDCSSFKSDRLLSQIIMWMKKLSNKPSCSLIWIWVWIFDGMQWSFPLRLLLLCFVFLEILCFSYKPTFWYNPFIPSLGWKVCLILIWYLYKIVIFEKGFNLSIVRIFWMFQRRLAFITVTWSVSYQADSSLINQSGIRADGLIFLCLTADCVWQDYFQLCRANFRKINLWRVPYVSQPTDFLQTKRNATYYPISA